MSRLPALFISHGSPMLALNAGQAGAAWKRIAANLPRPRAIVVASAHWLTAIPAVSSTATPATIHDFYGFPEPLFRLRYTPPGSPALAEVLAQRLVDAGLEAGVDPARGLDHGAWVPLMNMYPEANIPTFQLAIQPRNTPEHHWRVGQALRSLASEGVLVLASGSMTHNLRELAFGAPEDSAAYDYVPVFANWMREALIKRDLPSLFDYRNRAPEAARAHPTEEHLLPLFVALGAGSDDGAVERLYAGITEGGLAMDCYAFY